MKAPPFRARAAWTLLAILAAARIVAMFPRSMWAWGLNVPRFLNPAVAWVALAVLAAALVPPLGGKLATSLEALGHRLHDSARARAAASIVIALLAFLMWDQLWFLGDFMLRRGAIQGESMATLFQQSLPLDLLLHGLWPRELAALSEFGSLYSRILGAIEAGALTWLAFRFAASLDFDGAAYLTSACVVVFGGHLAFFTGFAKSSTELTLFTLATVVFGASLARGGRGGYGLGLTLALAFGLHRSSLVLLPAWLLACWLWFREHRAGRNRIGGLVALLLPAMMLVRSLPEMIQIARNFDVPRHLLTPEVRSSGGPLAAALQPLHLIDLANLALVLAPVGLVGLLWLGSSARRRSVQLALLATLALAGLPLVLFVHPQQGVFRDWDVFAPVGMTWCMLGALGLGTLLKEEKATWLAAPAIASVLVPTLLVLGIHHDVEPGLSRVRAFATEAPSRVDAELASAWDFLGLRAFRLARWDLAAEAFRHCDQFEPTRRVRLTWAISETMRGHYASAAAVYSKILARDDQDPVAWLGLGGAARRMGDDSTFARAARRLDGFMRVDASAKEIRRYLEYFPQAWPVDSSGDSLAQISRP